MKVVNNGQEASGQPSTRQMTAEDLVPPDVEGHGTARLACVLEVVVVHPRTTPAGLPWAVIDGLWSTFALRCVVFPTQWASLTAHPRPGDVIDILGAIAFRDGSPVFRVLKLQVQ
jgi:hypothetical protein